MNIQMKGKKGFTLIELMVVVIILGILAAIAFPSYKRAIERMRIVEVIALMGTERSAQDRNVLQKNHYTKYWHQLDVAPTQVTVPGKDNDYFNEDRTEFYTRGGYLKKSYYPSFKVYFDQLEDGRWFIVAERIGWGGYDYKFVRDFEDTATICVPNLENEDSTLLCTDFMGVETPEELKPDPRTVH